jgi:hypothetical protein
VFSDWRRPHEGPPGGPTPRPGVFQPRLPFSRTLTRVRMDSIGSESRSWRPAATPFPQLGACLSCGTPIAEGWRCRICRLALEQALGPPPVGGAP